MSEEKKSSFMQDLDLWSEATVIGPLFASETDPEDWEGSVERVKKAIREKVLMSYRNGQAAGPRRTFSHSQRFGQRRPTAPAAVVVQR